MKINDENWKINYFIKDVDGEEDLEDVLTIYLNMISEWVVPCLSGVDLDTFSREYTNCNR